MLDSPPCGIAKIWRWLRLGTAGHTSEIDVESGANNLALMGKYVPSEIVLSEIGSVDAEQA